MAELGQTVRVHYEGTLDDGTVFDSSYQRGEPLELVVGAHKQLAGFELAVSNLEPGELCDICIPAGQAYGARDESLVIAVPLSSIPHAERLVVGECVAVQYPQGTANVKVASLGDGHVVLDCNHELAGQDLHFHIELVEVMHESAIEHEHHAGCTCGCDVLKRQLNHTGSPFPAS